MQEKMQSFRKYINDIEGERAAGKATEPTYYPYLKSVLEALGTGVAATSNPKRVECGAPDFEVSRGETRVGYVEAKDVGTSLDEAEKSEQLRRYRGSLPNLILTDFLEFRWYVDGEKRGAARLGTVGLDGKVKGDKKGVEAVGELVGDFLAQQPVAVGTPKELAVRMARLAHMIREFIVAAFGKEAEGGSLHSQFTAFRDHLIPDLSVEQFADMYAQTVAYGLFAARAAGDGGQKFTRQSAAYMVPKTNPFLRRLFNHIAGPELDVRIAGLVDDLAQVLGQADMAAVLEDFGKRTKQEDPVVHFYETFLKAYDPKERKLRGVYYTPEPVVSYIVRSVDYLLRARFGRPLGLADPAVLVLDPAVGTGTFLYDVVKLIYERMEKQGQLGAWNNYVTEKLLPRLFGFELLMAPYAVAHLKLGLLLQELGYEFQGDQRLGVYLTNTLEEAVKQAETLFAEWITEEANAAAEIKKEKPIMVVLGNPPYAGHSANRGEWFRRLVEDYKRDYPDLNKPAQAKWLQDDYVKFLRFGQWRIDRTGQGVLAFITNHSYLDSPTFRGMRQCLMNTFTDIYVLDLHGNERKGERCPDGSPDKNVFDIQQGVAIGIFVKEAGKAGPARVHHGDLWGLREVKYGVLADEDIATTEWAELLPVSSLYLLVPQDADLLAEYERGWRLPGIMSENGDPAPGIVTTHDEFAISFSADEARQKVRRFLQTLSEEEARGVWRLCSQAQWSYQRAKAELAAGGWECQIVPILYRPFDVRWTVFDSNVAVHRRERVMRHMLGGENLALITSRLTKGETFRHAQVTRHIAEVICMSPKTSNNGFVFPLWIYARQRPEKARPEPGTKHEAKDLGVPLPEKRPYREANLSPEFVKAVEGKLGLRFVEDGRGDLRETFGPEDVLHYIYGVFHSPTYRARYAEFLKTDFPRLPLTSNKKLFASLAGKGAELVGLHLMESKALDALITKWPVAGSGTVEKVRYEDKGRRVWINGTQYFEGVPPEVWGFHVGGYQVCEKWLKDRKGRKLSWDDVQHYQRVVVALAETIRLMWEIDAIIPGWPLE
ncbi:MAG: N-6 DNA methylase [Dehalococcoidia bacterium]|nr:N-6 DNA methylase [Dehalococcoidia bacterium]